VTELLISQAWVVQLIRLTRLMHRNENAVDRLQKAPAVVAGAECITFLCTADNFMRKSSIICLSFVIHYAFYLTFISISFIMVIDRQINCRRKRE